MRCFIIWIFSYISKELFYLTILSSYLLRITLPHKRCLQICNSPRWMLIFYNFRWMLCLVHLHPHYVMLNYNVNSNAARDRWYVKCRTNTSLWFVLMKSEVCISTQWFSFLKKYMCRTLDDHIIYVRGQPSARKKKGNLKTSLYCLTPLVRNSAKCFIIKSPKRRSKKKHHGTSNIYSVCRACTVLFESVNYFYFLDFPCWKLGKNKKMSIAKLMRMMCFWDNVLNVCYKYVNHYPKTCLNGFQMPIGVSEWHTTLV